MDNIDSFRKQMKYVKENALTGKINMQYCITELDKMLIDYMARLIPIAENHEKLPTNYLKTKINRISTVDTLDINGRVFRSNNAYNIEVYIGLMIFIYKFFKILVSQTGTATYIGDNIKSEKPAINFDYIVPIVKVMLKAFWENRIFVELSEIETQQLSDGEIVLLVELCAYAEMFIVAHEIAHIIQCCNPSTQKFSLLPDIGKVSLNWSKEIDADILGLLFCIQCNSKRAPLCFSSIELFFIVQKMVVDFYTMEKGMKPKLSETHPPSTIRLNAIREFVKDMKPADNWFVVGEHWEKIGDHVLETIFPNTSKNPIDPKEEIDEYLRQKGLVGFCAIKKTIEEKDSMNKIVYPDSNEKTRALERLLTERVYCINYQGYWVLSKDLLNNKKELSKSLAWLACEDLGVPKYMIERLMKLLDRDILKL